MKLKNLQLVNYRNYDKLYIEFNDRINLLLGSKLFDGDIIEVEGEMIKVVAE